MFVLGLVALGLIGLLVGAVFFGKRPPAWTPDDEKTLRHLEHKPKQLWTPEDQMLYEQLLSRRPGGTADLHVR
jgi:hypothetical protein